MAACSTGHFTKFLVSLVLQNFAIVDTTKYFDLILVLLMVHFKVFATQKSLLLAFLQNTIVLSQFHSDWLMAQSLEWLALTHLTQYHGRVKPKTLKSVSADDSQRILDFTIGWC